MTKTLHKNAVVLHDVEAPNAPRGSTSTVWLHTYEVPIQAQWGFRISSWLQNPYLTPQVRHHFTVTVWFHKHGVASQVVRAPIGTSFLYKHVVSLQVTCLLTYYVRPQGKQCSTCTTWIYVAPNIIRRYMKTS